MSTLLEVAPPADALLTTDQLAAELGISRASLEQLRARGGGPAFIRVGARAIRYRRSDISRFYESRVEQPGSKGAA
jgi:predicted DNA-binding transcriptional regulator AlpA